MQGQHFSCTLSLFECIWSQAGWSGGYDVRSAGGGHWLTAHVTHGEVTVTTPDNVTGVRHSTSVQAEQDTSR